MMAMLTHTFTRTHNEIRFSDPYKKCLKCGNWIDGYLKGTLILTPCEHEGDYRDVCPSWSPVDGCGCAAYSADHPDRPIVHDMRPPVADDGHVY